MMLGPSRKQTFAAADHDVATTMGNYTYGKCVPLRAGDTFNARQTSKGLAVQAFNSKGKESEPTYTILQSKVLR